MTRRSSLVLLSIAAHAFVLVVILVGSVMATGSLPTLAQRLIFDVPGTVKFVDIHLPAAPIQTAPHAPAPENTNAAPIVAPAAIAPEPPSMPEPVTAPIASGVLAGDGISAVAPPPPPPLPPAPPTRQEPVRVSSLQRPTRVFSVDPAYPAAARAARIEGLVIIEAVIDTDGHVASARVLKSVALLDQAALDAVRQWRFTPTLLNGTAVPVVMTVTVNFALGK